MTVVNVRHPVPCVVLRRQARKPHLAYLGGVTPVELKEIDRSEVEPLGMVVGLRHVAIGGRLWVQPRADGKPAKVADLAAFLEGESATAASLVDDFAHQFFRTPVVAVPGTHLTATRGWPDARDGLKAVLEDGSERAAANVRRLLDEEVVVCGGDVYARSYGPLGTMDGQGAITARSYARRIQGHDYPFRLDRVEEMARFQRSLKGSGYYLTCRPAALPFDFANLPPELLGDDDVHMQANDYPLKAATVLGWALDRIGDKAPTENLIPLWRELQALVVEGQTGSIWLDRAEAVLGLCLEAYAEAERLHAVALEAGDRWARSIPPVTYDGPRRHITDLLLPRLRDPAPMDDADAEAFGGLGPKGL